MTGIHEFLEDYEYLGSGSHAFEYHCADLLINLSKYFDKSVGLYFNSPPLTAFYK